MNKILWVLIEVLFLARLGSRSAECAWSLHVLVLKIGTLLRCRAERARFAVRRRPGAAGAGGAAVALQLELRLAAQHRRFAGLEVGAARLLRAAARPEQVQARQAPQPEPAAQPGAKVSRGHDGAERAGQSAHRAARRAHPSGSGGAPKVGRACSRQERHVPCGTDAGEFEDSFAQLINMVSISIYLQLRNSEITVICMFQ